MRRSTRCAMLLIQRSEAGGKLSDFEQRQHGWGAAGATASPASTAVVTE